MTVALNELVEKYGLHAFKKEIQSSLFSCINIIPIREALLPIGVSKMGGHPDLPQGWTYPMYRGYPLNFIGQWNLDELQDEWKEQFSLPLNGMLYFFYYDNLDDTEDDEAIIWGEKEQKEGWRVLYFGGPVDELEPSSVQAPENYSQCKLAFELKERLAYVDIDTEDDELYARMDDLLTEFNGYNPHHQIGGTPWEVQNDVLEECEYYSGKEEEWTLLFQVDTDEENLGMLWGDVGMLYYCIPKNALQAKDFTQAWLIMQCH